MQAALRPRYTFREYLEIEQVSREVKHEYVAGEIFAMAGRSVEHSALATALVGMLFAHLRGGPCRPHGSDLCISIRAAEVATPGLPPRALSVSSGVAIARSVRGRVAFVRSRTASRYAR